MRRTVGSLGLLWLVGAACTGAIGAAGDANTAGTAGSSATGGRTGGAGGPGSVAACPTGNAIDPGPSPLRRLTKAEYNETVADLLGDVTKPAIAFPPESRVHGFDNHISTQTVTYTLADYTFKAAEQLAGTAIAKLDTLLTCNPTQQGESVCAETFIRDFGLRAFRRPLDDAEQASYLATYQKGRQTGDFKNGIRLVLMRMLASPHFLYRPELGQPAAQGKDYAPLNSWEIASRVSYLLWGTMPDQALFDAAARGDEGAVSKLFTADYTFMNRELASFLGLQEAATMGTAFERVALAPQGSVGAKKRLGILSSPGLLATHSKPQETSPVLRGRFVLEQMLCMELPLPPPGVPPIEAVDSTGLTTRERFETHAEAKCASCHKFLDPIGFAFENFDTAGRFRDKDNGKPVDTSGVLTETDVDGPFKDGVDLSMRLAGSQRARHCIATQWFRFATGRSETDGNERALAQLACQIKDGNARLRDILSGITRTDAFVYRKVAP